MSKNQRDTLQEAKKALIESEELLKKPFNNEPMPTIEDEARKNESRKNEPVPTIEDEARSYESKPTAPNKETEVEPSKDNLFSRIYNFLASIPNKIKEFVENILGSSSKKERPLKEEQPKQEPPKQNTAENIKKLAVRESRLNTLVEKTGKMKEGAETFADLAAKLAEQTKQPNKFDKAAQKAFGPFTEKLAKSKEKPSRGK